MLNWIISITYQYLKPYNCVQAIAILVVKQISSNSFKIKITNKLFTDKSYMYIYLNVC